jgi:hypothetical protein
MGVVVIGAYAVGHLVQQGSASEARPNEQLAINLAVFTNSGCLAAVHASMVAPSSALSGASRFAL